MRTAQYTNDKDEVQLTYHDESGTRCHLFYSLKQYHKRQTNFGYSLYPVPKPL